MRLFAHFLDSRDFSMLFRCFGTAQKRPYAYHNDPERLDMDLANQFGRMIVVRDPQGRVRAAGWDCADTRRAAKRWVGYGLRAELVPTRVVLDLANNSEFHVFATRAPVGETLGPQEAIAAFSSF